MKPGTNSLVPVCFSWQVRQHQGVVPRTGARECSSPSQQSCLFASNSQPKHRPGLCMEADSIYAQSRMILCLNDRTFNGYSSSSLAGSLSFPSGHTHRSVVSVPKCTSQGKKGLVRKLKTFESLSPTGDEHALA